MKVKLQQRCVNNKSCNSSLEESVIEAREFAPELKSEEGVGINSLRRARVMSDPEKGNSCVKGFVLLEDMEQCQRDFSAEING